MRRRFPLQLAVLIEDHKCMEVGETVVVVYFVDKRVATDVGALLQILLNIFGLTLLY